MGLKAMAEAALQQCAPRTMERTLSEVAPAQWQVESEAVRTLCDAGHGTRAAANDGKLIVDEADDFWQTLRTRIDECDRLINQLCDLRGDDGAHRAELLAVRKRMAPEMLERDIVYLKAELATLTPAPPAAQTRGRCIECEHFARAGIAERCSHPDRSPPGEPPRAECLPANQCERFIHWQVKQ